MYKKSGFIPNILRNIITLSFVVLIFSCSKSTPQNNSSASITSFSFNQSNNPIPVNSSAAISGTNISIFLPPGTNPNALIPSFTLSDSAIVRVNGVAQVSGVTPGNFSGPVSYNVVAASGVTQTYTVTLTTDMTAID